MKNYVCTIMLIMLFVFLSSSCSKKHETTADGKRIYKIAIGYFGPDAGTDLFLKKCKDELNKLGYRENDNLKLSLFHAGGEMANIPQQFQAADNDGNDLIVALTTPCIASAATVVKKTKVVFAYVYDAVAAGVAKSLTDHLPNLTGIQSSPPLEKTLQLMRDLCPNLKTIATIYNAGEANSVKSIADMRKFMTKAGINLKEFTVASTNEIAQAAAAAMTSGATAIWITGDNTIYQSFEGVLKFANLRNIPVFINESEFLNRGATASVGIEMDNIVKTTCLYIDRVIKGENPQNMPILNVSVPKVEFNNSVMNKLNLKIPENYLNK